MSQANLTGSSNKILMVVFILMVLVPRLCIDLLLPGLPSTAEHLQASLDQAQLTMTFFMLGYAASMLITGPLSDCFGVKRVACCGILLFVLSSIVCTIAQSMITLIAARFFQALGGCCGTVIARVVIRVSLKQEQQIYFLALLSTAMAVSPIAAPITGSIIVHYLSWRWVFVVLFSLGILLLYLLKKLPKMAQGNRSFSFVKLLSTYRYLLSDPRFLGYSLTIGLAWFNYFLFTVESPLLIQGVLKLNAVMYGVLFALAISGYVMGTQVTRRWANVWGWNRLILLACLISIEC